MRSTSMVWLKKVIRWFAAAEEDGSPARTHTRTCDGMNERKGERRLGSLCLIRHKLHLLCHSSRNPMSYIPQTQGTLACKKGDENEIEGWRDFK